MTSRIESDVRTVHVLSMWRTGSTWFGNRLAAAAGRMLFYEPFHEVIGSRRALAEADLDYRARRESLRHPPAETGYFDVYSAIDPESGAALRTLFPGAASLRDVYRGPSAATARYLAACERVARGRGLGAVFGFCRSGLQIDRSVPPFDARRVHLWRDPRSQFASYDWPRNDYFVPGTVLQLLASPRWAGPTLELLEPLPRFWTGLLTMLPHTDVRNRLRVARRMLEGQSHEAVYAVHYLAWSLCRRHADAVAERSFSLAALHADARLRTDAERWLGIDLRGLEPTVRDTTAGPWSTRIESEVERVIERAEQLEKPS